MLYPQVSTISLDSAWYKFIIRCNSRSDWENTATSWFVVVVQVLDPQINTLVRKVPTNQWHKMFAQRGLIFTLL